MLSNKWMKNSFSIGSKVLVSVHISKAIGNSIFKISIEIISLVISACSLLWFYGMSTLVGYLMPNPESDSNDGVLHIPQSASITGAPA